jgi:hypothetical protein
MIDYLDIALGWRERAVAHREDSPVAPNGCRNKLLTFSGLRQQESMARWPFRPCRLTISTLNLGADPSAHPCWALGYLGSRFSSWPYPGFASCGPSCLRQSNGSFGSKPRRRHPIVDCRRVPAEDRRPRGLMNTFRSPIRSTDSCFIFRVLLWPILARALKIGRIAPQCSGEFSTCSFVNRRRAS